MANKTDSLQAIEDKVKEVEGLLNDIANLADGMDTVIIEQQERIDGLQEELEDMKLELREAGTRNDDK